MKPLGIVYGKELLGYAFPDHPFGAGRGPAFWEAFQKSRLASSPDIEIYKPAKADEKTLLLFHTKEYLDFVKKKDAEGGLLDYGDTPAFKGVYDAVSYVAGSAILGLEKIISGEVKRAFVPIAGLHHANRKSAGGFCVFNDVGVAIEYARKKCNLKRILYVDIDAHHCNGVFYAFESEPDVWIADIHEKGIYPGTGQESETGKGDAKGTKLNIPLRSGSSDKEFREAFQNVIEFGKKAKPELIIFQCGCDGLAGDPITSLKYTEEAHRLAARELGKLADEFCEGKILALGGGGYNLDNIAKAWMSVVKELASPAKL